VASLHLVRLALHNVSEIGKTDSSHGRGVLSGAKVGNGVTVGAGVGLAFGFGVEICAWAPAKKASRPIRTHTPRRAIPDRMHALATA